MIRYIEVRDGWYYFRSGGELQLIVIAGRSTRRCWQRYIYRLGTREVNNFNGFGMERFVETIKVLDGQFCNLEAHERRAREDG